MKFKNDLIREPFKIKGAKTDKAQYQIQEFPDTKDWLRLIDLKTGKKASHETFFYLLGRDIEIVKELYKIHRGKNKMSKEEITIDDYTKGYYNQGIKDAINKLLENGEITATKILKGLLK